MRQAVGERTVDRDAALPKATPAETLEADEGKGLSHSAISALNGLDKEQLVGSRRAGCSGVVLSAAKSG
jgi:hypothetical protein